MSINATEQYIADVDRVVNYLDAILAHGINVPVEVMAASDRLSHDKRRTGAAIERAERAERAAEKAIVTAEIEQHLEAALPDSLGG